MRTVFRQRIALAAVALIAALAWMRPGLEARPVPRLGGMGAAQEQEPVIPRIYYKAPISKDAALIWMKLQQKIPMKFANETPLEDVLKSIQSATADGKETPTGIPFYIDPVGLQEADKTLQSPVTINLDSIRVETALTLVLKQLGMSFRVHPDGLIYITSEESQEDDSASAMILDKLDHLEREVRELRTELKTRR